MTGTGLHAKVDTIDLSRLGLFNNTSHTTICKVVK